LCCELPSGGDERKSMKAQASYSGKVIDLEGRLEVELGPMDSGAVSPEHFLAAAVVGCVRQALEVEASTRGVSSGAGVSAVVELTSTKELSARVEVTGVSEDELSRALELCPVTSFAPGLEVVLV
jgi:uncharacterized OsmC-like protein